VAARCCSGGPGPFADLEALRAAEGLPVSRFARLTGIPERTYRRRLARLREGDPPHGPWPSPKVDRFEPIAAKYAEEWPAWGHRKIAALMRADGYEVSTSTVERALRRRDLLLPQGFRVDRKSWAMLRRKVFRDPPVQRNRVWQTDFSEIETTGGGIWRICAVIDYATKYCLAITVTPTARGCVQRSVGHARTITFHWARSLHDTVEGLEFVQPSIMDANQVGSSESGGIMLWDLLITVHACAGVIAFVAGCAAITRRGYVGPYFWSLVVLMAALIAAIVVDWSSLNDVARAGFTALTLLGCFTVWRAARVRRCAASGSPIPTVRYLDDLGFTLIALFDGFVVIAALDVRAPPVVAVVVGVIGVVAGRRGLAAAKRGLTGTNAPDGIARRRLAK
jgi:hypothetical protein